MEAVYNVRDAHPYELLIKRSLLLLILMFLLYRLYAHLLPHQLMAAPLTKILYYPELHAYRWLGLDDILVKSSIGSRIFSAVLFIIPLGLLWKPRHVMLSWMLILSMLFYHTVQAAHMTHSVHFLVGVIIMSFIFLARDPKVFNVMWDGLRYAVCGVYVSAFLWKIIHGAFFQFEFGEAVFKSNLATYYFLHSEGWMRDMYAFFLTHPYLLSIGTYLSFIGESLFIFGFFTKRWDAFLIIVILLLHHFLYLFVDTLFVEWYIFIWPLISIGVWRRLSEMKIFHVMNR